MFALIMCNIYYSSLIKRVHHIILNDLILSGCIEGSLINIVTKVKNELVLKANYVIWNYIFNLISAYNIYTLTYSYTSIIIFKKSKKKLTIHSHFYYLCLCKLISNKSQLWFFLIFAFSHFNKKSHAIITSDLLMMSDLFLLIIINEELNMHLEFLHD